mgnify:CR=1 FL=1
MPCRCASLCRKLFFVTNYQNYLRVDVDISIHSCIMVLVIGMGLITKTGVKG